MCPDPDRLALPTRLFGLGYVMEDIADSIERCKGGLTKDVNTVVNSGARVKILRERGQFTVNTLSV
jgi:hypothetical protein